ncbi:hypothetical protein AB0J14_34900 [Micromonospora arborensis]|uniref:hypothetical protein n=1 Tax=Micromonospora arborensis TaxID=2116518 RepID=UPI0034097770
MGAIVQQVSTLLGVLVGVLCSYLATRASERERWRREHAVRWSDRRVEVYASYADAVKRMGHISLRICAAHGFGAKVEPLSPDEGISMLAAADADRSVKWELLLLLGNRSTVTAARAYNEVVWQLEKAAKGSEVASEDFDVLVREAGRARDAFYAAARRDLALHPD